MCSYSWGRHQKGAAIRNARRYAQRVQAVFVSTAAPRNRKAHNHRKRTDPSARHTSSITQEFAGQQQSPIASKLRFALANSRNAEIRSH
eukprot:7786903-Alexandrium_andersonii.AAC.1